MISVEQLSTQTSSTHTTQTRRRIDRQTDRHTDKLTERQTEKLMDGWLSSPLQHSIGYMGDGFYRSKDPTNSIIVLKEKATKEKLENAKKNKIHTYIHNNTHQKDTYIKHKSSSLH